MDNPKNKFTIRTIVQMLVFILLVPFLPLLLAGDRGWWQAWVYALNQAIQYRDGYRCG